ncbi:hypothetical protein Pcinc_005315 [Petrolisthes cinctipes]|uniref:TLDc domain-containing protein n=1 Tax=Petrolisthes cinctipes TaxID=88211 RepID=A0AAE1GF49_PETCI|nr:hypothetical protein Pcinc_005315 [Petrolisthes cinctipes]
MGNSTSQEQQQGSTSKKGFLWSGGLQSTSSHDYPDFLVKLAKVLVAKSLAEDHVEGVTQSIFLKHVCNTHEVFGKRLFNYIAKHWSGKSTTTPPSSPSHMDGKKKEGKEKSKGGNNSPHLSKSTFLAGASHIISLLTDKAQMEFYIKVFSDDEEKIGRSDVEELVFATYHSSTTTHKTCCLPDDILAAVVTGVMHGKGSVNTKYLQGWLDQHCPRIVMWLHRSLTHILTTGHRTIPLNTQENQEDRETPILDCPNNSSCLNLHPALIWLLTCSIPRLYTSPVRAEQQRRPGDSMPSSPSHLLLDPHVFIEKMVSAVSPTHWLPLYNSDTDGLSINRFQHHVFGYQSATLMFLTAEEGNMFCLACDQTWRDSQHFWGGDDCLCLHLTPEYKIIEAGPKIAYFNVSSRGYPTGLQVGTDYTNRALTLDLDLTILTYRRIPLRLKAIEVWGCGTVEAKNAQVDLKKRESRDTENRRKVKIDKSDWLDNPDRYLIEMAGNRLNYAQYETNSPGGASGN